MSRLKALGALAAAGVLLAAGCGSSTGPSAANPGGSKPGSVVVWTNSQPSSAQSVVAKLIKQFNASYPGGGHVSISWIGGEAYKSKLAVSMAGHHPPTVFYTYGGQLLDQYIEGGNVADVSAELAADPTWKSAYAAKDAFGLATYKGGIYGIPANGPDYELMWQNAAVLAKAGVTAPPTTWPEFSSAVTAIKKSGASPITIAGKDLWPEMIWMQYLTLRYGGPGVFDDISALKPGSWNNPAVLSAATTIQQLAKSSAFEPGFNTVTFASGNSDQILAAGKAGFQAQLYYDAANMRVYAPAFASSKDFVPSNFPSVPGGKGDPRALVGQPAEYFGVSKYASAAQRKEALAWIKYETTSLEFNTDFLEANGFTPLTAEGAKALLANKIPNAALLYKLYQIGTTAPSFQPYWDQDLPSAVITPMLTDIGELFDLTITPQQFVDHMNTVLAQVKK